MSPNSKIVSAKKFSEGLSDILSKKLRMPVYSINSEAIEQIVKQVEKDPDVTKNYSSAELYREVGNFLSRLSVMPEKSKGKLKENINIFVDLLKKEKSYEATIVLPGVLDLPLDTKIGSLKVIKRNKKDKKLKEVLEFVTNQKSICIENRSFAKVKFKSYTTVFAREELFKQLELPLAFLSLIFDLDMDPRDCPGLIRSPDIQTTAYLSPQKEIIGWSKYRPDIYKDYLDLLSSISIKSKPNKISKKILQALRVYGLSRLSYKPEIRFLLLISSFEALLLTKNDRDYLGKKLSEKTAFLMENSYKKRIKLYKLMKQFYNKRSDLVHTGTINISDSDVRILGSIFKKIVFRILELSKDYSKMEQKSHNKDKKGVEDLINELKFGKNQ